MRPLRTTLAVASATLLVATLFPAASAVAHHNPGHGNAQVTVDDAASPRFLRGCDQGTLPPPYSCDLTLTANLRHTFRVANKPPNVGTVQVGWEIVEVTAVHGVDYTGPTSGTISITGFSRTLLIPLLDHGDPFGPEKTLEVHITSVNFSAQIGAPATGTIEPDGTPPVDCDLARPNGSTTTLTCNDRPPDQTWRLITDCLAWGIGDPAIGNLVTGNGTSVAVCNVWALEWARFFVLP